MNNSNRGNMVTRLWKTLRSGLKTEDIPSLHVCQWQSHKKVLLLYLLYRWISAIIFLTIIVCSCIDIGRSDEKHEDHYAKWWIYLTHWTVLICVVQVLKNYCDPINTLIIFSIRVGCRRWYAQKLWWIIIAIMLLCFKRKLATSNNFIGSVILSELFMHSLCKLFI